MTDNRTITIKWWGCMLISLGCGLAFGLGMGIAGAIAGSIF